MKLTEILKPGSLELTQLDAVDEDQLVHALQTHRLTFNGHDLHEFLDTVPGQHTLEQADALAQQLDTQEHPDKSVTRPHVHDSWWYYTELFYRPKHQALYGVLHQRVTYRETSYRNRKTILVPLCFKSTDGATLEKVTVPGADGRPKSLAPGVSKVIHIPTEADDIHLKPYFEEFFQKTPS